MYSHGPNLSLSRIFSFGHAKAPSSETRALRFPKKSCPKRPFSLGKTPVDPSSLGQHGMVLQVFFKGEW